MHDITVICDVNCHDANICYNNKVTLPITVSNSKLLFFFHFCSSQVPHKEANDLIIFSSRILSSQRRIPCSQEPLHLGTIGNSLAELFPFGVTSKKPTPWLPLLS